MHHPKSYMVPKMIFVNVLALIMITFEQVAPAEVKDKPQGALVDVQGQPPQLQVAAVTTEEATPQKPATAKRAVLHTRKSNRHRDTHLIRVKSTPVNCCFRGNI